jgi:hypothetical protein
MSIINLETKKIVELIDFTQLKNKKVLVTGASGLVGIYLISTLKQIYIEYINELSKQKVPIYFTISPKKKDPTKNPYYDPNIAATQTMFNKLKITDNAGRPLSVDGVWGWRTEEAKQNFFKKYPGNSPEGRQYDDYAEKVRQDLLWRLIPDKGTGKTARMGPPRSKGKDPAIGEPSPEAAKAMGISVTPGATPGATDPAYNNILASVGKLEAILKKYNVQAECAYKEDGTLLTEDDWVLKHINMFTPQEQMEIWKVLSEAELTPFGTVGADIAARRRAGELDQRIAKAQANMANRAAQNAPQQQSTLSKFGKNLAGRFGLGGGKRGAAKGIAKLGLRAIPFLSTAWVLYDVGSALYDTFAKTEIADLSPEDQQAIAAQIKSITEFSKSADYNNAPDDLKKRITAVLNSANKLAQGSGEAPTDEPAQPAAPTNSTAPASSADKTSSGVTVSNW